MVEEREAAVSGSGFGLSGAGGAPLDFSPFSDDRVRLRTVLVSR